MASAREAEDDPCVAMLAHHLEQMDVDWPNAKRRRMFGPLPHDSALWGLCDALAFYASTGHLEFGGSCSSSARPPASFIPPMSQQLPQHCHGVQQCNGAAPDDRMAIKAEPLLRALTQLANAAAAGIAARRQLVAECQVHAPLLRLMLQLPWAAQPLVVERCCRLVHWLCARAPENRETLAAHRGACSSSGARSVSFMDAVLNVAEAHPGCREVLAHALRALIALLPCPSVREELMNTQQQRLLTCLVFAGEVLDSSAVRAVCKWLPGFAGEVRRTLLSRGRSPPSAVDSSHAFVGLSEGQSTSAGTQRCSTGDLGGMCAMWQPIQTRQDATYGICPCGRLCSTCATECGGFSPRCCCERGFFITDDGDDADVQMADL